MPVGEQLTQLSRGRLSDLPMVEIMGFAYARRLTGRLRLVREDSEKTVLFLNGLPVWAGCDPPGAGLLEILAEVQRLSADDLRQLQSLQREKGADDEALIRMFGLASDTEVYELQVEACTRVVLAGCGWRDGRYAFRTGEDQVVGKPLYDLNPLELIYHGIRAHHLHDLPELIQQLQGKRARLNHGWESTLALPGEYYRHSDLLDHFEHGANIGEAIPCLYAELGDLNDALLFLYLLLVTGILQVTDDDARREPKPATRLEECPRPEGKSEPHERPEERAAAATEAPVSVEAGGAEKPAGGTAGAAESAPGTSYIITGKRRKGKRRAEPKPVPPQPEAMTPPRSEPELPPAPVATASVAPAIPPAMTPPGISDDDWLFGETTEPTPAARPAGLGLPDYYSPPSVPDYLMDSGPPRRAEAFKAQTDVSPSAPGWGAEPEGSYGQVDGRSSAYGPADDDDDQPPESELMALPDTEYPYFEEEEEERPRPPEPKGVERKKVASALRKTRAAYEELGARLTGEFDHYERLGVEMDADVAEIEAAYESVLDRLALEHLPEEAQAEFAARQDELCARARESYQVLIDPNERIALEQAIYNKHKARSRTTDQKQKLAAMQWRRGKWYLENSSRADLGRRCFQEALELDPKPQYFAYVGWALYRNNRSEYELLEARSYLRQALERNPSYGEAHYFLGLIAKREGEMETARGHFAEAVRLNPEDRQALREFDLFQRSARPQGILGRMFRRG